jgi:hypothetical protein
MKHLDVVNHTNIKNISQGTPQFSTSSYIASGAYPDLAFDKDGRAHLVYVRNGTLRYRKRSVEDKTWSTEIDTGISQGMVNRSDPEVAVDNAGRVHVLVGSTYAWLDDDRWKRIDGAFTRDTDLALNSAGDAFIVRRGGHDKGFLGLLKHCNGAKQFEILPDPDIAAGFPLGRNDHVYGSISISPVDDSLHIVYRHATPKKISYRVSNNGGQSWQGSGITDKEPEAPDITVTKKGKVFVANADGHVFQQGNGPEQWIDLGQAFQGSRRDLPRIEVDLDGAIHVVAFGGKYNSFSNGRWNGLRILSSRQGKRLGYAEMAIKFDGTVCIVYEEGNNVQREKISGESAILMIEISKSLSR